jgi:uncharacterized protein (TIGR02466 family)
MIKNLFPTQIYYSPLLKAGSGPPLRRLNKELLQECSKFVEIDDEGHEWSEKNYHSGYTSYGSITHLHEISPTFAALRKELDKHVRKYLRQLQMDVPAKQIQMRTCWINVMPTGALHTMHIHPLSVISGTYYVQTPKNCSALKFEDPRMSSFMASPPPIPEAHERNRRFVEMKAEAGHLILFESWLRHEVPTNRSAAERVSISFNYDWV